jgi:hypothetical protein
MENLSILNLDPGSTTDSFVLDQLWNLAGVPNLQHQFLLAVMELIVFLHSDLDNSFAVVVSSNHFGVLQWKSIEEIGVVLLVVDQNVQVSGLNRQLLRLVVL